MEKLNPFCFVLIVEADTLINFYIPMDQIEEKERKDMIENPENYKKGFVLLEGDIKKWNYPCELMPYYDEPFQKVWVEDKVIYNQIGDRILHTDTLTFIH